MKTRTADILSFLFVAAAIAVAAWLYPALPGRIPTHCNAAGEIDDYTGRHRGMIILPVSAVLIWALMKIIPVAYSYLLYRRLEGFSDDDGERRT